MATQTTPAWKVEKNLVEYYQQVTKDLKNEKNCQVVQSYAVLSNTTAHSSDYDVLLTQLNQVNALINRYFYGKISSGEIRASLSWIEHDVKIYREHLKLSRLTPNLNFENSQLTNTHQILGTRWEDFYCKDSRINTAERFEHNIELLENSIPTLRRMLWFKRGIEYSWIFGAAVVATLAAYQFGVKNYL